VNEAEGDKDTSEMSSNEKYDKQSNDIVSNNMDDKESSNIFSDEDDPFESDSYYEDDNSISDTSLNDQDDSEETIHEFTENTKPLPTLPTLVTELEEEIFTNWGDIYDTGTTPKVMEYEVEEQVYTYTTVGSTTIAKDFSGETDESSSSLYASWSSSETSEAKSSEECSEEISNECLHKGVVHRFPQPHRKKKRQIGKEIPIFDYSDVDEDDIDYVTAEEQRDSGDSPNLDYNQDQYEITLESKEDDAVALKTRTKADSREEYLGLMDSNSNESASYEENSDSSDKDRSGCKPKRRTCTKLDLFLIDAQKVDDSSQNNGGLFDYDLKENSLGSLLDLLYKDEGIPHEVDRFEVVADYSPTAGQDVQQPVAYDYVFVPDYYDNVYVMVPFRRVYPNQMYYHQHF